MELNSNKPALNNVTKKMFWVDLEMTGLDEYNDKILEIGVIITDINFKILETYHRIVYQEQSVLDNMNDWCKENHGKSGLSALVPKGTPQSTVEKDLIAIVERFYEKKEKVVLCGNSVGMDKRFIDVHMPDFAKKTHYRIVDVTSFKEVVRNKYGINYPKAKGHRALDDIKESIAELQCYMELMDDNKAREIAVKYPAEKKLIN